MPAREPYPEPYLAAIHRGFQFASELGRGCGPVHLLVGLAEGRDEAAAALTPAGGGALRDAVTAAGDAFGDGTGYLHMQAQEAARSLAEQLGRPPHPGHLLIALLDQGSAEVLRALELAGLDRAAVRQAALAAAGAPAGLPPVPLPPPVPAGTAGRPPLPVAELDERAWAALRWRQDHLPLDRVRRRSDWLALQHLELDAAWRIAGRLGLDDDQRYSAGSRHFDEVRRRVAAVRPGLVRPAGGGLARARRAFTARSGRRRPAVRILAGVLGWPLRLGWDVWLGNRWVSVHDRWFWFRTRGRYRNAPQL